MELKIPDEALWVSSPLSRAIDTFMLSCPLPHRIGCPTATLPVQAAVQAGPSQQQQAGHPNQAPPLKLAVRRYVLYACLSHQAMPFTCCSAHCCCIYCCSLSTTKGLGAVLLELQQVQGALMVTAF